MHEADHRYLVSGYVRDGQGEPKSDVPVSLEHKAGQKYTVKTNGSGYYEAIFHLHDDNLGDEVSVTVSAETKKHTIAFDFEDKHSARKGQVDFGAPGKETPLLYWLGWGGALLAASAIFFFIKKKKPVEKKEKRKK
ncbi:MAG: carboxypeptidase-like regulatory domain-containing protein [Nitrospirota bacterium]